MHDKYSTCKHEHATCTCQIVTAQIADAGQLQDNEARLANATCLMYMRQPLHARSIWKANLTRVPNDKNNIDILLCLFFFLRSAHTHAIWVSCHHHPLSSGDVLSAGCLHLHQCMSAQEDPTSMHTQQIKGTQPCLRLFTSSHNVSTRGRQSLNRRNLPNQICPQDYRR